MNYCLMKRHEVATNQIVIRYVENQQKLAVLLPIEDRIVSFDVPWADDAFFDTLADIGSELMARDGVPIRTVYAYENDRRIVVQIDDKMWQFKKPTGVGFATPGAEIEGALFSPEDVGPTVELPLSWLTGNADDDVPDTAPRGTYTITAYEDGPTVRVEPEPETSKGDTHPT